MWQTQPTHCPLSNCREAVLFCAASTAGDGAVSGLCEGEGQQADGQVLCTVSPQLFWRENYILDWHLECLTIFDQSHGAE
jgi:hypothetical protein